MCRIDVLAAERKGYRVMINFIQQGIVFSTPELANDKAKQAHAEMPAADLHLLIVDSK